MKFLSFAIGCLVLFSGCYHKPEVSDLSGVTENKTALLLLEEQSFDPENELASVIALIERVCDEKGLGKPADIQKLKEVKGFVGVTSAAVVPVVSAFAKLGFDLYMDKQARQLKEVKKATQKTYSARLFATREEFSKGKYLALVRYRNNKENMEPGFILVCELINQSDKTGVFTMKPVYATAFNSVAITAKADARVSYTAALSLKAAHVNKQKLYEIVEVGKGVVSFKGLEMSSKDMGNYCSGGQCSESDLIAAPVETLDRLSITLSVTETGNMKIDFDKREAELKAVKEAVGPTLKDFVGEVLKSDE